MARPPADEDLTPLLRATLELLRSRGRGHFRWIAEELGYSYDWVCQLSQGRIPKPGVQRIERLHGLLLRLPPKGAKPARQRKESSPEDHDVA